MNPANPYQHIQDANHIRLLAIFHCVYGGLCVLAGVGLIIIAIIMVNVFSTFSSIASTSHSPTGWPTTASTYTTTVSTYTTSGGASLPAGTTPPSSASPVAPGTTSATSGPAVSPSTYGSTAAAASSAQAMDTLSTVLNIYCLMYGIGGLLALILGTLSFISAHKMTRRRGQTFSLVVAGIHCLAIPLGTVLGVFTFVVLLRPSVVAEYERGSATRPGHDTAR